MTTKGAVTPNHRIPMADLSRGPAEQVAELAAAVARVIGSGRFVNGPDVAAFEEEMARYLGVRYCVGLNSGTDALVIGLRALGVGPGDAVIVPAFTFVASAQAVSAVGAELVLVDIDPSTFNLDPARLERAVTPSTKAIIAVHLFGQSAALGDILAFARRHGLKVLEDVAQATGGSYRDRRLGAWGDAAAFSFFPTKNLGAWGDGGLLATSDPGVAEAARELRQHGGKTKYESARIGYNSRLDSLQAAVLRVKLPGLDASVALRREAAARYDELLAGCRGLERPGRDPDATHAFNQYTLRLEPQRRDLVRAHLARAGVETLVYYPAPMHRLAVYRERFVGVTLPHSERACDSVLSVPLWPGISVVEQQKVAGALVEASAL